MRRLLLITTILLMLGMTGTAFAQATAAPGSLPQITLTVGGGGQAADITTTIKLLLLFTVLSFLPSIVVMMTSFTRIVVVLGFMRQALGTNQAPSNQIVIGLALFLTMFIMWPVGLEIKTKAYDPYVAKQIEYTEAGQKALKPLRQFMLSQVHEKDLALFARASKIPKPDTVDDLPIYVIIPAFMISELRTAFTIGFMIYLPFLIIDMIVASVLMSMGMMMLPPIMISLPFKLMVFVLADGWFLIIGSLISSFGIS